jgi:FixJ family two-component response regulator
MRQLALHPRLEFSSYIIDVVKAIKLGAVDFLKKPLHDILPLVRKLLSENINDDEVHVVLDQQA